MCFSLMVFQVVRGKLYVRYGMVVSFNHKRMLTTTKYFLGIKEGLGIPSLWLDHVWLVSGEMVDTEKCASRRLLGCRTRIFPRKSKATTYSVNT